MKRILIVLGLILTFILPVLAGDNIITNNYGQSYIKDNSGKLYPMQIVFTGDGAGNIVPVTSTIEGLTIGTVQQGANGSSAQAWFVQDIPFKSDFDAWKPWADVNLSTRAADSSIQTLIGKFTDTVNGLKVDGSAVTQPVSGTVAVSNFPATQPVSGTVTSNIGTTGGLALDTSVQAINTKLTTTANGLKVDNSAVTQPISAASLPLPTGAALESGNLASILAHDASIDSKLTTSANGLKVDGSAVTQPVSAVSLPLPSNAAIETGGNLASINSKITTSVNGVKVDGSSVTQPVSGTVAATQSGNWSTRMQDGNGNIVTSQLNGSARALDVGVNVGGVQIDPRNRTWNLSNSTDAVNAVQSGTWNITNISGTVSLPTGAANATNQTTINSTLTTISGQLPGTLGAKTTANSMAVNIASDQIVNTQLGNTTMNNVMVTGSLVSTAVTANQTVVTYTVTSGKTFYLTGWDALGRTTTISGTATNWGTCFLQSPSGTTLWSENFAGTGSFFTEKALGIPMHFPAGQVVVINCTPAAATSYTWFANIFGYEI